VTYTEVINAEKKLPGATLTKPNPYMFLKGMLGLDYDDGAIVNGDYDASSAAETLVVGDAGADILAARAGGMDFAAVLTGVSGQNAREYFEQQNSTYIIDDISGLVRNGD
jgi:phosphoglycolate phosphatase-like HAD superfamily hydrolase